MKTLFLLILLIPVIAGKSSCGEDYNPSANTSLPCSQIFDIFHKCTGRFLEVSLDTANPFTLCTDTLAHGFYRNLTFWLNLLEKTVDPKNNVKCSEEYLYKNKISVISHIVAMSKSIWNTANCDDCYVDKSINQTFSEHTVAFQKSFEKYQDCRDTYRRNSSALCKHCLTYYLTLNELFDHEKMKREGKICFDLEDTMNKTRQEWSVDFRCCRDKKDSLKAFYSLFSTIMILAVIFYVSIYVTGSSCTESTIIDASEITISINPSTSSGSSSLTTRTMPVSVGKPIKLENHDDSSDDEPNILQSQSSSNNNQLITLDN